MANTKSALQSIKVAERNRLQNRQYKSSVATLYKKCMLNIMSITSENAQDESKLISVQNDINLVYSKIDKCVKKNIFHANKGARKKSSLARAFAAKKLNA